MYNKNVQHISHSVLDIYLQLCSGLDAIIHCVAVGFPHTPRYSLRTKLLLHSHLCHATLEVFWGPKKSVLDECRDKSGQKQTFLCQGNLLIRCASLDALTVLDLRTSYVPLSFRHNYHPCTPWSLLGDLGYHSHGFRALH